MRVLVALKYVKEPGAQSFGALFCSIQIQSDSLLYEHNTLTDITTVQVWAYHARSKVAVLHSALADHLLFFVFCSKENYTQWPVTNPLWCVYRSQLLYQGESFVPATWTMWQASVHWPAHMAACKPHEQRYVYDDLSEIWMS